MCSTKERQPSSNLDVARLCEIRGMRSASDESNLQKGDQWTVFDTEFRQLLTDSLREVLPPIIRDELGTMQAQARPKKHLTVADVADTAQCHPDTVRRAIRAGTLKASKPKGSRRWLIDPGDLARWMGAPSPKVDPADAVEREITRALQQRRRG